MNAAIDPLISVNDLLRLCQSTVEQPILIGVLPRWRFRLRHLPGSLQVWRPEITEADGASLINLLGFEHWARSLGIDSSSRVVLWDECYDAPRLWWAFHHYGKHDVQVLDGGLSAWRAAGLPLHRGRPATPSTLGQFTASIGTGFEIAERGLVLKSSGDPSIQVWDTREKEEWEGRKRVRGAHRAGRIAWAKHLGWRLFRRSAAGDLRFTSKSELITRLDGYGLRHNGRHIFYCQSGVRTTTAILGLYRLGWDPEQLLNYDGSWREWSREPDPQLRLEAETQGVDFMNYK